MIAYSEIEAESVNIGVPLETIEKDYHLDWYLAALWNGDLFPDVLFYGGTAIKKLYLPHHRFSEDIDLISPKRLSNEKIAVKLDQIHQFLEKEANLFCFYRTDEIRELGTQTRFLIHYRGFSEIGGMKRFLLDFAQGIEGLPRAVSKPLISSYRDLKKRKILIQAFPVEVISADKLVLVIDRKRKEPRDLYDLWAVLMNVKSFDPKLFFDRFWNMLAYRVDFSIVKSSVRRHDFKNAWDVRLKHQVRNLPDFEIVTLELIGKLETLWRENESV